jgi:hypothetical protein
MKAGDEIRSLMTGRWQEVGRQTRPLAGGMPWLEPRRAFAAGLSGTVNLTTWPNYHSH